MFKQANLEGKARKGVWGMPRHTPAKKDAANSEMRR